ncbi:MAG TPA: DUF4331 family protein [Flavisolibacter sp.]|jgi:hypothetical protein|nr:DUF4331 family protein [Flavisolibacter sp.]
MLRINNRATLLSFIAASLFLFSCKKDDDMSDSFDTSGTYTQKDQMARPAINTVFVGTAKKDQFNMTIPSQMSAAFKTDFLAKLAGFGYTQNALGQNADQFASLLATDVLNVKMSGTTTFFDGTNVLTGRALADDVIDTELLLIFGGPTGTSNPGLTKDNVNANDKAFSSTFPYLATPW